LGDPVGQILRAAELLHVGVTAFGDRGQEVQHWPVGDELEMHVTILTGDAGTCKARTMTSPVEQVTIGRPRPPVVAGKPSRRRVVRYFAAALAARSADEGARVALVLLALERTGSASIGGVLVAALLIPHVVTAPLIGSLVDRSRRPGRVVAIALGIFAAGIAAAVVLLGKSPIWLACLALAVAGSCGPAITGGLTSRLGGIVEPEQQARAFGLDSLFYNVASMAGPAGVALAAAVTGADTATLILAGLAVLGAVGVLTLRLPPGEPVAAGSKADLLGGVRAIAHNPPLRALTLTTSAGQLGPGALAVVATVLAASIHRPEVAGLLLAVVAAGALLGSLLWTWRPLPAAYALSVTGWAMIGIGTPIAVAALASTTGHTNSLTVTVASFGVSGLFIGPFAAALFLARNQLAPAAVRTQIFTIGAGLKVTASALGAALIGYAAGQPISTQLLLVAASPLLAGIASVMLLRRRRG
jgi:hypothetical protein